MEDHLPMPAPSGPPPSQPLYGLPGYDGLPLAPFTISTIIHTAPSTRPLPIHSIPFPHSPSPLPFQTSSPSNHAPHDEDDEGTAVPRYYKLSFPMFDGKDDPLGWLNCYEHFFRAHRTREADKVWLASFHMTGLAQHWYSTCSIVTPATSQGPCSKRYVSSASVQQLGSITWPIWLVCNSVAPSMTTRRHS
jgi:hypothetical protein